MKHSEKLGYISYERPHQWLFIAMLLIHLLICVSTAYASSHLNYQIPFPSNLILLVTVGLLVFNKNRAIGTCATIALIIGFLLSGRAMIHYLIAAVLFGLIFLFIRFVINEIKARIVINEIKARTSERNNQSDESDITTSPSVPEPDTPPINTVDTKGKELRSWLIFTSVFLGTILVIGTIFWLAERTRYFTPGNPSTSPHLNDGLTSAAKGLYFEAISHYDLAIKDDPDDDRPYYYRGKAKAELNQHTAAILDYDSAIRLNPKASYAYSRRGWSKYRLKQYSPAIADYNNAISIDPDDAHLYSNRGMVKFRGGQRSAAITDCDKAIQLSPYYGDLYRIRGWMKYETDQLFEAITDCDQAIRLEPNNARAYFYRGLAKQDLGHYWQGRKDLEQAFHYAEEAGDHTLRRRISAELGHTQQ